MSAADDFLSLFDEHGRFRNGDGEARVVFLTGSGTAHPGKLQFKRGRLVSAAMEGASPWGYPDESPLDGLKFLLHFQGEKPIAVLVEQGRIIQNFRVRGQASKETFLANLGIARNLFIHARPETDGPTMDPASISDALTRGALWLTPKLLEGFNAADFPELEGDTHALLLDAIQAFTIVAREVPADKPPTNEQYGKAAVAFIAILKILGPYLSTPEECKKVEKALRNVTFPPWVVNWDYELGSSHEGDAAVRVIVFAEENVARSDYGRFTSQIIPMIRQALAAEGVSRWPYIRLRTAMEYKTA